jgi:hypothetical protein
MGKFSRNYSPQEFYCKVCKKTFIHDDINKEQFLGFSCPNCGHLSRIYYFNKPDVEYKLFELQEQYLDSNRDKIYLEKIYPILYLYTKKLLLIKIKGKKLLSPEDVDDRVRDTAHKIFEYFLRDDQYGIMGSFAGCINNVLLDSLFCRKKVAQDQNLSLNTTINEKSDELMTTIIGIGAISLSDEMDNVENQYFKYSKEICNNIFYFMDSFLTKIDEVYHDSLVSYKISTGINHLLIKRSDHFMDRYYDFCGNNIKNLVEFFYTTVYYYLLNYATIGDINGFFEKSIKNFEGLI